MSFQVGQKIIYSIQTGDTAADRTKRLGIVENVWRFRKKAKEYDIRGEDGKAYISVPSDDFNRRLCIDTYASNKIANSIKTNLTINLGANLSDELIQISKVSTI